MASSNRILEAKNNLLIVIVKVQEVQVKTTLDKEGMKAAVQRVTGRVP